MRCGRAVSGSLPAQLSPALAVAVDRPCALRCVCREPCVCHLAAVTAAVGGGCRRCSTSCAPSCLSWAAGWWWWWSRARPWRTSGCSRRRCTSARRCVQAPAIALPAGVCHSRACAPNSQADGAHVCASALSPPCPHQPPGYAQLTRPGGPAPASAAARARGVEECQADKGARRPTRACAATNPRVQEVEECQAKLAQQEALVKYFKRVRDLMCSSKSCPACYRDFSTDDELHRSVTQLDADAQVRCWGALHLARQVRWRHESRSSTPTPR